ncbi:glycosyltransferase family 2 protein [Butyrivibrio sp. AC2005]|uniref:glycosyltransferase family 2 protein n=1 Tax=Butyrivibrio sp. AC2005 TaxID=1280672 RepID=UPI00040BA0B1|nr:glycosyltransferase family 2 protein [Butyrivibrio sp. AC2005]
MNYLISVILTVYNREHYIHRCIDSILSQKNVNIELIIVDDGSKDSSPEICDEYAAKNVNVKVIHQKNAGISVARNVGLDNVTGDFIFFMDDDDFLPENALQSLLNLSIEHEADLVIGNYAWYKDDGSYYKMSKIPEKYCNKLISNREVCELLLYTYQTWVIIVNWGKLYRKQVWDNIRFPAEINKSEDQFVFVDLMESCKKIYLTDQVVYNQVLSKRSISRSKYARWHLFHAAGVSEIIKYLISKGYFDIAMYKFGMGTRDIIFFRKVLKDEISKKEIKRLYGVYCNLAKELAPHVNFKTKMRLLFFRCSLKGYAYFQVKHGKKFARQA